MKKLLFWCVITCGLLLIFNANVQSQSYTWTTIAALPGTTTSTNEVAAPGIVINSEGNIYVADSDNRTIRQISQVGANWVVTTVAGLAGVTGRADGTNASARFVCPCGITVDADDTLYVMDSLGNNTVRKVARIGTNWIVTTLAGMPGEMGSADGTNSSARFSFPFGIAVDVAGKLYVADLENQIIRKVAPVGTNWVVSTIAGSGRVGGSDGTNRASSFYSPFGACVDGAGNLYVTDQGNQTIRRITPIGTNWVVSTIAGQRLTSGSADGTNRSALFNNPGFLVADSATNLYVADRWNNTIRKISPVGTNWVVSTVGGLAGFSGNSDGLGSDARFFAPSSVAVDRTGNLYVVDFLNHTIRKGVPFAVTTFPQSQGVPTGTSVSLSVAASGDNDAFTYQWLFEGALLQSETNALLSLGPVGRTNTGTYSVLVSNAMGNWTALNATVRALVPSLIQPPQIVSSETIRLMFQDVDGGLPYDLNQVRLQWRAELPHGSDTSWQTLTSACYVTNGFAAFDDTNSVNGSSRVYRILER